VEPGQEVSLTDRSFALRLSEPVEFPLFVSSTPLTAPPGALAAGRTEAPLLADPAIRRDAYESGRPSEAEACRRGDARFLPGLA
jgi:hypothetical protein